MICVAKLEIKRPLKIQWRRCEDIIEIYLNSVRGCIFNSSGSVYVELRTLASTNINPIFY